MPQYVMRDIPDDLWSQFTSRAKLEGWPLRPLFFQLMKDFGSGQLHLSSPAPESMQAYAWLRPFWRTLARHVEDRNVDAQWIALKHQVKALRPQHGLQLERVAPDQWRRILAWLQETSKDPKPGPNKLTMRAIAHIGSGPKLTENRQAFQYEVIGLPPGQQAFIANLPGQAWCILRVFNGEQDKAWRGHHATADDALRALESEIYLEQDVPGDTEHS